MCLRAHLSTTESSGKGTQIVVHLFIKSLTARQRSLNTLVKIKIIIYIFYFYFYFLFILKKRRAKIETPPFLDIRSYMSSCLISLSAAFTNCSGWKEALINGLKTTKRSVSDENAPDHFPLTTPRHSSLRTTPGHEVQMAPLSFYLWTEACWTTRLAWSNTLSPLISLWIVFRQQTREGGGTETFRRAHDHFPDQHCHLLSNNAITGAQSCHLLFIKHQ